MLRWADRTMGAVRATECKRVSARSVGSRSPPGGHAEALDPGRLRIGRVRSPCYRAPLRRAPRHQRREVPGSPLECCARGSHKRHGASATDRRRRSGASRRVCSRDRLVARKSDTEALLARYSSGIPTWSQGEVLGVWPHSSGAFSGHVSGTPSSRTRFSAANDAPEHHSGSVSPRRSQLKWIGNPSPSSMATTSVRGRPTMLV
jgi:hypothetical protein